MYLSVLGGLNTVGTKIIAVGLHLAVTGTAGAVVFECTAQKWEHDYDKVIPEAWKTYTKRTFVEKVTPFDFSCNAFCFLVEISLVFTAFAGFSYMHKERVDGRLDSVFERKKIMKT